MATNTEVFTIETPTAIVRIHPGKMTEGEREAALKKATVDFYRAVTRNPKTKGEWPND